jgi:hypothetical protein
LKGSPGRSTNNIYINDDILINLQNASLIDALFDLEFEEKLTNTAAEEDPVLMVRRKVYCMCTPINCKCFYLFVYQFSSQKKLICNIDGGGGSTEKVTDLSSGNEMCVLL